jgi:hypothetical protein
MATPVHQATPVVKQGVKFPVHPPAPAAPSKTVVKPAEALKQVETPLAAPVVAPVQPVARWKFVKQFGVGDYIKLANGSRFQFKLIKLNDGSGYASSSELVTTDEGLADSLRAAAKNPALGVVEVKV